MFSSSKDNKLKLNRVATVIGQGTEIKGDITFIGGLHLDGTIKGNVTVESESEAMLSLSELGLIEGNVYVPRVILNGAVRGNVVATEHIELASNSKVNGDVKYKLMEMAVGAEVNGKLIHIEEAHPELAMDNVAPLNKADAKKVVTNAKKASNSAS